MASDRPAGKPDENWASTCALAIAPFIYLFLTSDANFAIRLLPWMAALYCTRIVMRWARYHFGKDHHGSESHRHPR